MKVFISYSHKDEDWVKNWLLPKLENDGLQTHIDYRDFEIGVPSVVNMERAVEQCANTILVLSPNWINSEWAQFEGLMLQTQDVIGLRKRILPLMFCDCQLPLRLKIFTYADFRKQNDWYFQLERIIKQIKKDFAEVAPKPKYPLLSDEHIDIVRLPKTEFELFGRATELNLLDEAWQSEKVNVLSFVAYGGVGKTTLVNKWLEKMRWDNFRGAQKVYAWSFYSQGTNELVTSADTFFNEALKWFGEKEIEKFRSPWDKGKRLAELVRMQKTLLILDGMEPLQSGYDFEKGKIKDAALSTLITELAKNNNGLCIITTREAVPEVERYPVSSQQLNLERINEEAGCALLKVRRVQGTDAELQKLSSAFGNHALAINLLAEYLRFFPGHPATNGFDIPDLDIPEEKGKHARRVMEAVIEHFGEGPELELLMMLGLFSRPAPQEAIDAVMKIPVISGLTDHLAHSSKTDWLRLLQKLRDLKIIAHESKHKPDIVDCHPLVREHFGEKLKKNNPQAWKEAHSRLYEYYKNLPKKELPDTLEEMEPLFAAVVHGCQAGKHQEVAEKIYFIRIQRDANTNYCCKTLGAFGADLAAISNFFEVPWNKPLTNLIDNWKAGTLNWAGYRLRALGRLREAVQPMQAGLEQRIKQENWGGASKNAGNLSELYLTMGEVEAAVSFARKSVDFADRSGDENQKYSKRTTLADALLQKGELAKAEQLSTKAESIQKDQLPNYSYLFSLWGFRYCDLLLSQGKVQEVLKRAKDTIEIAVRNNWLLGIALDKLSLGRAYMLQAVEQMDTTSKVESIFQQAADYLNQAVEGLREAETQHHIPRGLFARVFYYRVQNEFAKACNDLEEAREIAERGEMKLYLADYNLEACRLCLAEYKVEEAENHLNTAADLINKMGYGRRQPEILLLKSQLHFAKGNKQESQKMLAEAKSSFEKMGIKMWDWEVREMERKINR